MKADRCGWSPTVLVAAVGLFTGALVIGWFAWSEIRARGEIETARVTLDAGHYHTARKLLRSFAARRERRADVELLLGRCSRALGLRDEAEAAWNRVPPSCSEFGRARFLLAQSLIHSHGDLTTVEARLREAIQQRGDHQGEAVELLGHVLVLEGRTDEAANLYRQWFDRLKDPIEALRSLDDLRRGNVLIDKMKEYLERARRTNPRDDRVWLGLASVAMVEGRFEEADRLLRDCERRRPADLPVCRARLRYAIASASPHHALVAAGSLRESDFDRRSKLELWAWAERSSHNRVGEVTSLSALLAVEPANAFALARLAELAAERGKTETAVEYQLRKSHFDQIRERYRELLFQEDSSSRFRELARLADELGLRFESRQFRRLANQQEPPHATDASRSSESAGRLGASRRVPVPTLTELLSLLASATGELSMGDSTTVHEVALIPRYVDIAPGANLRFAYDPGGPFDATVPLPQMMGGGVGVLDFDGDGWFDVYVSQGGRFPPETNQSKPFGDRLFRNRGDGTFEDATERSGLARFSGGYGLGVTVGDYDSDGWPDLFVTRWDHFALYRNLGDGRFADVTETLGLSGRREWPASAAWGDFDGDRDLDLYVCHYLSWDPDIANEPESARKGSILQTPLRFRSVPDHLFRNDQARFVDVTESSGIHDPDGRGLGVVVADLDGDRRVDIYVANDMTANFFFRNEGGGRFRECASEVGLAGNSEGGFQASMGIACGDQDGDGRIDLAVTNFYLEATTLYHNLGSGMFADDTRPSMLFATTRTLLGFGTAFLDTNRDGVLDLASANGHIYPGQTDIPFRMPTQLLLGTRGGRFRDVTVISGEALAQPRVGRALVPVDYDNDGRLELVLVSLDSPLALFRAESGPSDSTHSVTIVLEGTESNREGIGATVRVVSSGRTFVAPRYGGGSYQSTGDPRLHFGLGNRSAIERVEIDWPSGRTDRFSAVHPDAIYRAKEGSSRLERVIGNDLKK